MPITTVYCHPMYTNSIINADYVFLLKNMDTLSSSTTSQNEYCFSSGTSAVFSMNDVFTYFYTFPCPLIST